MRCVVSTLPPSDSFEAAAVSASAGTMSEEVGQACVTALAERDGKTRQEVVDFLTDELRVSGAVGVKGSNCNLAMATASPVAIYFESLSKWFRFAGPLWQLAASAGAILVGTACAMDGPAIWRALFTILAALTAAGVTHHEAAVWELTPNFISDLVLMSQVAAATALAVHVGFEGSQVLLGVLLGLIGAYGVGDWARDLEQSAPGLCLLWYEVGAVAGFLLYTIWRKAVLSTLAPLVGCLLATTGIAAIVTRLIHVVVSRHDALESRVSILPAPGLPWMEVVTTLLGHAGSQAVPVHFAGAMVAALVHGCFNARAVTISVLLLGIVVSAVSSLTGFVCDAWPTRYEEAGVVCPMWLKSVERWEWPIFGSLVWAILTGVAAWRQLGMLEDWEKDNFWRSDVAPAYFSVDDHRPAIQNDMFATKPPDRYPGHVGGPEHQYPQANRQGLQPHQQTGNQYVDSMLGSLEEWWSRVNSHPTPRQPTQHPP